MPIWPTRADGNPAAASRHLGERKIGVARAKSLTHSDDKPVEQRQGERAPFNNRLAERVEPLLQQRRIARLDDSAIDEQTAIAVFGEPGQPADVGHVEPRLGERLDQRIDQPLAELVKRYEPIAGNRAVAPAITN